MSAVAEWRYGVRCAPCGVWAVRACGARERAERRGARAAERDRVVKLRIADGTALRNIVGEEVAATFRAPEDLSPRALCLCRYAP